MNAPLFLAAGRESSVLSALRKTESRARGEMADALVSGTSGAIHGGSSPLERTLSNTDYVHPEIQVSP